MPVVTYDASSRAAVAYRNLAREFIERPVEGAHPAAFSSDPIDAVVSGRSTSEEVDDVSAPMPREAAPDETALVGHPVGEVSRDALNGPVHGDIAPAEGAVSSRNGDEDETDLDEPAETAPQDATGASGRRSRWPFRKAKGEDP
jgi:hypothetical protein